MDSTALSKATLEISRRMMRRNVWGWFRALALAGFLFVLLGGMTYMVNTNQKLQSEISEMRLDFIKKNSLLANRIKRNAIATSQFIQSVQENEEKRLKRSASDAEEERGETITNVYQAGGVTYERWGRRDCSGPDNKLLYHGMVAGSWYAHTGGPANYLCLDMNVTYTPGYFTENNQGSSYIYGMEYRDTAWANNLFDLSLTEGVFQYHSVPCAICLAKRKTSKLMIPGREICPEGWTKEYTGFIMSGGHGDKHSSTAVCVDDTPQVVPGTQGNQNGAYLYLVELQCASLLCEPFVVGRELRCVVCTI